jgi:hypothetical protein
MCYSLFMSESQRTGYRSRLEVGQTVFLAEGINPYKPEEGELRVKKATVHEDCKDRRYAVIQRWDDPDTSPGNFGLLTTISPRALFTENELRRAIASREEVAHLGELSTNALLTDTVTNAELAVVLGQATIGRMADDLVRRPHDPEY